MYQLMVTHCYILHLTGGVGKVRLGNTLLYPPFDRWCREGHIPFYSAPYLLRPDMEVSYYDLFMLRNTKKLPDAKEVQGITGRLAVFLSIQYVPLPPTASIVRKFVKLLNLPGEC